MPPDHVPPETRRRGSWVSFPKPFWTHTGTGTCRRSFIEPPAQSKVSFAASPKPGVTPAFPSLATPASVIFGALRGPGAKGTLKARPVFTEATAKQCPPLRAQERVGGHGRGRVCRAGRVPWPGRGSTSRRPRLRPAPRSSLETYVRRDTAGAGRGRGRPLYPPGASLHCCRPDRSGEGGSSRAFESGARAARPRSRVE